MAKSKEKVEGKVENSIYRMSQFRIEKYGPGLLAFITHQFSRKVTSKNCGNAA